MIGKELKELQTSPRHLRQFGLTVGGVFLAIALFFLWRQKPIFHLFVWPGAILLFLGLVAPKSLRLVFIGWMAFAMVLGHIVSTILLTLFFFLVVTPVGLAARLLGKDFLHRKLDSQAATYWTRRPAGKQMAKADYENQF
jgi:hypothetical protein